MRKQQVTEKQTCLAGKIWTMLKRYMGKRLEGNAIATGFSGCHILYKLKGFWSFSMAALSDAMSNPFFSLGSLMMDATDSQLLLGIRIVSLWSSRLILNVYTNKNIHFWNVHLKFPFKASALPLPGTLDLAMALVVWGEGRGHSLFSTFLLALLCERAGDRAREV